MARLIDADALMERMKRRKEYVGRPSDPVCLVEDAPTIGGWISVKDRLPDAKGIYLARLSDGVYRILGFQDYGNGLDWYEDDPEYGNTWVYNVTHWLPLPEPPEVP